jgi:arginyl-tRNA synthetase
MKEQIKQATIEAVKLADPEHFKGLDLDKLVEIKETKNNFGDYSTNIAMLLMRYAVSRVDDHVGNITMVGIGMDPVELAQKIVEKFDRQMFESVEAAAPGFINFRMKNEVLLGELANPSSGASQPRSREARRARHLLPQGEKERGKILLEYFQPNIAKPLHIGHLRTAVIGDALKRMMKYVGLDVESDNHLGDWGTQFGVLILAYKKYGNDDEIVKDPITELNKLYVKLNSEIENDKELYEQAKNEFVKLESGDPENRKIWKQFTQWSLGNFRKINAALHLEAFEHEWPESFYEDRMPDVLKKLKRQKFLVESEGAQIVRESKTRYCSNCQI